MTAGVVVALIIVLAARAGRLRAGYAMLHDSVTRPLSGSDSDSGSGSDSTRSATVTEAAPLLFDAVGSFASVSHLLEHARAAANPCNGAGSRKVGPG